MLVTISTDDLRTATGGTKHEAPHAAPKSQKKPPRNRAPKDDGCVVKMDDWGAYCGDF